MSSSTALSLVDLITRRRLWELDRMLADTDGIVDSTEKNLLLLRLKPLVRQIEKEARAKKNKIPYMSMNADSENRPDRVVTELCKVEFTSFAKFVLAIHDSLSAVRQHRGSQQDAQHIRDSFSKLMVPLIEREKEHFRASFPDSFRSSCEIAWVDFPESSVGNEIKLFCRAADKLKKHWSESYELEVLELELQQEGQGVVRARQEKAGEGKTRRAARQDSRKARIAEIKRDHPKRANEIRYICVKLDATNTPLPPESQWEDKSKQRTWLGNYAHEDTRSAVQRYVSEVQPAPPKRKHHS